jgi:hypothetical protein
MRLFKRFFNHLARLEEFRAVILMLVPGAGAYMTYVQGAANELPTMWIVFAGAGVFAFIFYIVKETLVTVAKWRLQEKLVPLSVEISGKRIERGIEVSLVLSVQNQCEKSLFLTIKEQSHSIDGRTSKPGLSTHVDAQLPPRCVQKIYTPPIALESMNENSQAALMMRIGYGKDGVEPTHAMKCEYIVDLTSPSGQATFLSEGLPCRLMKLEYSIL